MAQPNKLALQARYLFPVDGPPVENGVLTISDERIVELGPRAGSAACDLGNVAILPGLVNAHTHLEFSDLPAPLGQPGMAFTDWIRLVIASRHRATLASEAVSAGVRESLQAGTTALGEIATSAWSPALFACASLEAIVFLEAIALLPQHLEARLAEAEEHVSRPWSQQLQPGLSPHAPYTVHPQLLSALAQRSAAARVPVAFHLAESRDELQLLQSGSGRFVDLLEELGRWDPAAISPGSRPLDYLQQLSGAHRALVIHGNYLDAEEQQFLAGRPSMSLVYCPRTHAYFGHDRYPLEKLLALGVQMSLGTDSRASNPDLSLWSEIRYLAEHFTGVSPAQILELGTICGACALGQDAHYGSLTPGKLANLAIIKLPDHKALDPYDLLFGGSVRGGEPMAGTWFRGAKVH